MAYEAKTIANFFLSQAKRDDVPVSPMKLLKLLYFAHGWYLAITGEPLLEERIEAWIYGPVIPDIYLEFKQFGNDPITGNFEPHNLPREENHDVNVILGEVWKTFKGYSAVALSNMTHEKGTPWSKTMEPYRGKGKFPKNLIIDDKLIKDFFVGAK